MVRRQPLPSFSESHRIELTARELGIPVQFAKKEQQQNKEVQETTTRHYIQIKALFELSMPKVLVPVYSHFASGLQFASILTLLMSDEGVQLQTVLLLQ